MFLTSSTEWAAAIAAARAKLTAALEFVHEGDVLVVTKPDRLARSIFQSRTSCPIPVVGHPTGHTQFTVVLLEASSTASDSMSPISPNFDAQ